VPAHPQLEPVVLNVIAAGDFFCLPPSPRDGAYRVRAVPWARANGDSHVLVALWARDTMLRMMDLLTPGGHLAFYEASWLRLSRPAEHTALMLRCSVTERLRLAFRHLARRFGVPRGRDTLIDLWLPDTFLARLVGTTRATANRAVGRLHRAAEIVRH